jgi:tyrosine-protein phosphatase YwqE
MGFLGQLFRSKAKKSLNVPLDLNQVKIDMHSHLIPGIDDGSPSMEHSLAMLMKFQNLGFKKVITTPHVKPGSYPNTSEIILDGYKQLKAAAIEAGITLEIEVAAEYFFDETLIDKIKAKDILSFGDHYVLVEFAFNHPPIFENLLFDTLIENGYKPVLAHFERYSYYFGSMAKAQEWQKKGVAIQLNLNSLCGAYGPEVKRQAEAMMDQFAFDFVGTDCHRMEHLIQLEDNLTLPYLSRLNDFMLKNSSL